MIEVLIGALIGAAFVVAGGITVKYDYYNAGLVSESDALKAYVNSMPNSIRNPSIVFVDANTRFMFIGYKSTAAYASFLLISYNGLKKAKLYDGIWTITDL